MSASAPESVPAPLQPLLASFREGRRAALARAISLVEDERPGFEDFLHAIMRVGPRARRLGLTGPPGAGKSTLIAALARAYRGAGDRIGVVAVDPTSPFSGGALLGDRIRMSEIATDEGLFIRSMATRGSLGGLATTTREVADLMDGFGFERVLVETVGVGQTELEITGAADTVVVVLVPESGDAIQAMKAGLMEIADVFVVNKADRPGADRLIKEIRTALHLRTGEAMRSVPAHHGGRRGGGPTDVVGGRKPAEGDRTAAPGGAAVPGHTGSGWEVPVIRTVAHTGEGTSELIEAVAAHSTWLDVSGELERRRLARSERRVREVVERALRWRTWKDAAVQDRLASGLDRVIRGEETPYSVGRAIIEQVLDGRKA